MGFAGTACDVLAAGSLLLWVIKAVVLRIERLLGSGRCTGCLIWFKLLLLHLACGLRRVEVSCDFETRSIMIDLMSSADHSSQRAKQAALLLAAKQFEIQSRLWVSSRRPSNDAEHGCSISVWLLKMQPCVTSQRQKQLFIALCQPTVCSFFYVKMYI